MNKLLNANFYRLKKSRCFWTLFIIIGLLGIYMYINNNGLNPKTCVNCENELGEVFFSFLPWNWIIMPIFISIFAGNDFTDGTIKNKIIVGHSRLSIYLSNLLVNIIVSFIYSAIYIITIVITSLILKYSITIPTNKFIDLLINSIFLNISFSAIFTFISMICTGKSSGTISLVVVIWSIIITTGLLSKLSSATGIYKTLYECILKLIPYGQAIQINDLTNNYGDFLIYSIALIIIFNFYGIILFDKKELN